MESDRPIPLIEAALDLLRSMQVIAPGMTTLEQLIVRALRCGERWVQQLLLQPLTADHKAALDAHGSGRRVGQPLDDEGEIEAGAW